MAQDRSAGPSDHEQVALPLLRGRVSGAHSGGGSGRGRRGGVTAVKLLLRGRGHSFLTGNGNAPLNGIAFVRNDAADVIEVDRLRVSDVLQLLEVNVAAVVAVVPEANKQQTHGECHDKSHDKSDVEGAAAAARAGRAGSVDTAGSRACAQSDSHLGNGETFVVKNGQEVGSSLRAG